MPDSKPAVSGSRESFLQEIFNRHFPNGAVGVWEFGEDVARETRERCAQDLKFVGLVLDSQSPECGDLEALTIEEWLIQCGFYEPTEATEPCSLEDDECGGCICAESGFPTICNRWTDLAREADRARKGEV